MADTRRSFFASTASWLASLPLLSAWLARPVEASDWEIEDRTGPGERYESLADYHAHVRVIRWIPIEERLPIRDDKSKSDSIDGLQSRRVQIATDMGYVDIASLISTEWGDEFSCGLGLMSYTLRAVTHWSELPSPPNSQEGVT